MRDQVEQQKLVEVIDLAAVPDFELGLLRVRPSLRRVVVGTREESVEPRVMQALIALAEANGAVISRDALINRCWGGRIVGEDAINRCIAKVRRLAALAEPAAFTIETVSRIGYRLLVQDGPFHLADAAETGDAPPGFVPAAPPRPAGRRAGRWLIAVAAVAMAAACGLAAERWRNHTGRQWVVQNSHALLPSLDRQSSPRVSPGGSMLAYVAVEGSGNGRIYIKSLQGGLPVPVSPAEDNAASPAWASDGARLAYAVVDRQGAPCRIMVTAFPGGTPATVGRCRHAASANLAWQPGTQYLFFTDHQDGRSSFSEIVRMSVDTGAMEPVTSPRFADSDDHASASPDGASLAYIRDRGFGGSALRVRNLATGEERELECDRNVASVDWAPDSRTLFATAPSQFGGVILAYPLDGAASYKVYASASNLGGIAIGGSGTIAVAMGERRTALARASAKPASRPDIIDPAAGLTDWPAFAPDGTLAFISTRSGDMALWTRKPGGVPVERVSAGLKSMARPVWSPDGTEIAFFEVWKGEITLRVVTAQGENVVSFRVPSIGFGMPNWAPDGQHIIAFDRTISKPVVIDLRHPDHRVPLEQDRWDAITYRHGAIYSARAEIPGLWQLPAALGGTPRLITPDYPAMRSSRITFLGDDVLLPDTSKAGDIRILAQPLSGGATHVAFYAPAAEADTAFAVDPLSGDVLYVSELDAGSQIDLLTLEQH